MTNSQKSQRFYEEAKRHLRKLAGVSGSRPQRGYFPRRGYTAGGAPKMDATRPGTFDVQFGIEPSDADVQAFIRSMGGDPFAKKSQGRSVGRSNSTPLAGGTAPAPEQGESIRALIERMAADVKSQQDAANAANEARYGEVKQSNADLYGRVMGEVDNWGGVQQKLNEERAKESMGNIRGNLAARGLTDSTIGDAFQARNDRDLALTQQDLSEKKSARRLGYDIDLTNNANAFIERRTDRGPDNTALLALSAKLGEAEAYRKGKMEAAAAAQRRGTRSRGRSNQPPYLGPQGIHPALAAMLATGMQQNFLGGLGGAMGMMGRGGGGPAYISNRYPTKRTPEEYAATKNQSSGGGGITSNSHPVGFAGNVAGLAYNAWPGLKGALANGAVGLGRSLRGAAISADRYGAANATDDLFRDNWAGAGKVINGIASAGNAAYDFGDWLYGK
jgi:hypothetical protein